MKFLVDAQLPRRLARQLVAEGHDVLHTLDLPDGNQTPDSIITELADREDRVVVSKDADFVVSHTLSAKPHRLLLIATGNINNDALEEILRANLPRIIVALDSSNFVEVGRDHLISHE
jgi:predicted nuclease of predicted toxin-antitoxin system